MIASYDHHALWMKARLFINHAMDDEPRSFDEQALWASLSLELLAKAALSKRSPLLIATPSEDGDNLLTAAGLIEGDAQFKSIPAHTLYSRCSKAFKPFSEKEAKAITGARNNYLHGASARFSPIPAEAWWPKFWAQALILIYALDLTIEDFVGFEREKVVEDHLDKNRKNVADRVEMLISHARQRLAMKKSGRMTEATAREFSSPAYLTASLTYSETETCPACGAIGTIEGDDVETSEIRSPDSGYDEYEGLFNLEVVSDYFSCPKCRLVLNGTMYITQAGLPETFLTVVEDTRDWGDEYGND